ncbi:MAG: glycosyltransferase family 2 protein [Elusimicrobiota bacterium]
MTRNSHFISIVIPLYNEEHSLPVLIGRIKNVMHEIHIPYEVILINDGSTDNSKEVIKKLAEHNKQIKYLSFNKNFGKAVSLNEGFKLAKGSLVITMDADLQDKPEEIPVLLEKLKEGYDLVSGWKKNRKDQLEKRLPSKLFNYVIGNVTGLKIHDYNCGFKLYRREVIESLNLYGEMHRYIPALAHWKGFRIAEVEVKHSSRKYGKSKYGIKRYMHGLFDFMTVYFLIKYMSKPMHFFGKIGLISTVSGFVILLHLTIIWFSGEKIGDRPLLNLGILLFILGIQFISTGLISELIIYLSKKNDFQ